MIVVVKPYTVDFETGKAVPSDEYELVQCYKDYAIIRKKIGSSYKVSVNRIYRKD